MKKLQVLVIDDEKIVADSLAMVLNISGFEATAVYSGLDGLKVARNLNFELLVSDVVMYPMNGIEAAIEICRLLPNCRILLLSGSNDTADMLAEAGSRGYEFELLAKPAARDSHSAGT